VILPFGDAHARAYQEKIDFSDKKSDKDLKQIANNLFGLVGYYKTNKTP
jgi:hypothetical protein